MQVLAARLFDHKPLLIHFTLSKEEEYHVRLGFQIEAKWMLDEEF